MGKESNEAVATAEKAKGAKCGVGKYRISFDFSCRYFCNILSFVILLIPIASCYANDTEKG